MTGNAGMFEPPQAYATPVPVVGPSISGTEFAGAPEDKWGWAVQGSYAGMWVMTE